MSIGRRFLVAVTLIAVLGLPALALAMAPITISGDVTLTTAGSSGGNRLVVKLIERKSDGVRIERASIEPPSFVDSPPYHFNLPADTSTLNTAGSTYLLEATIALNTSIRFQDSKAYTPGSTGAIVIPIKPATGYLPYSGNGDWLLLVGILLALLSAILAGWRWLRMRPLTRQLA